MSTDIRVVAVRENKLVGRGSCSSIDECMEDSELVSEFNRENITTPKAAVRWAIQQELLHLERGLNQRWGEDDDSQLLIYKQFKAAMKGEEY